MVEKTITMSYSDYQLLILENEELKRQFNERLEESKVYLTLVDIKKYPWDTHKMTGQIVEKDALLNKMQMHLDGVAKRGEEREANYERRIERLKEELYQASIKSVATKWWHKLLK
jgi:hypothetical protein